MKNNQNIELFDDIYFSPTPINFITDTIGEIIENNNEYLYRTIHISGGERISRYQLGQRLKIIMNSESKIIPKKGLHVPAGIRCDLRREIDKAAPAGHSEPQFLAKAFHIMCSLPLTRSRKTGFPPYCGFPLLRE